MNTVKIADRVESKTQGVNLSFCVEANDENFDSYANVGDMTDEQLAKVAKRYGITPALLSELNSHFDALKEAIHEDLADIWARVQE